MTNSERAAYIKGLLEGLELDQSSKEVKVINAMVELLDDLCLSIEETEDAFEALSARVDEIDEDLGELEEDFYEFDDDDDDCDCGCGCSCGADDDDCDCEDDCEACNFEVICPSCGDKIELNEAMLDEGFIHCPGCNEKLEFDFEEEDENEV